MDEIKKLRLNIESLFEIVNSDKKFFSSIILYVGKLNCVINDNPIDIEELDFLISKVEEFYKKYRPDGTTLYIPPRQTSNSDSIVREIIQLITNLKNKNPNKMIIQYKKVKKKDLDKKKNNILILKDKRLYDSCKSSFESKDYWNFVFNATRHLEVRIREKANLDATDTGTDLINKAFNYNNGCLKIPFCQTRAEEEGFFHILRGIVMFHRNAKGHREGTIEKERAFQIVNYIDYLIYLIESAVKLNK